MSHKSDIEQIDINYSKPKPKQQNLSTYLSTLIETKVSLNPKPEHSEPQPPKAQKQNGLSAPSNRQIKAKPIKPSTSLLTELTNYLEYNEILNLKNTSRLLHQSINKQHMSSFVLQGGITQRTRKKFWLNNINFQKVKSLVTGELHYELLERPEESSNLYRLINTVITPIKFLTEGLDKHDRPIKSKFAKINEEIGRDLDRTFHESRFNTKEGKEQLERILLCIAYVRPEIGYCQGMNFVAGSILELMDDEELSFWIMLYFLDDSELNSLYFTNMPDYNIRVFQLNYFIKSYFPQLFYHFRKNQISSDIFLSKWILTIFSSYLPFSTLAKIWDIFLIEGWKAIMRFSLVFLESLQSKFLTMDLHDVSKFLRENNRKLHRNIREILVMYGRYDCVTNELLDVLRDEYFLDCVKRKIANPLSKWDTDQTEAYGIYTRGKERLEGLYKENIMKYKKKLENNQKLYQAAKSAFHRISTEYNRNKNRIEELIENKYALEQISYILNNGENGRKSLTDNKSYQSQESFQSEKSTKQKDNERASVQNEQKKGDASAVTRADRKESKKVMSKFKKTVKEINKLNAEMLHTVSCFT